MMHYEVVNGKRCVLGRGLLLRPKTVDVPEYEDDYNELLGNLSQLLAT
jgi:hypothetical protein